MDSNKMLFFIIAGEASGDLLGAGLMRSLKNFTEGKAFFVGVGGERMLAEGLESIFPYEELAQVGIFEIALRLPSLLRRMRQTVREIGKRQPIAVITIDSPDFNFRIARKVKKFFPRIPLIHYVAPTVWAWRPGRARMMAGIFDHLMTLLPFEPQYFIREGLPATFVGHPIVESGADKGDGRRFRQKNGIGEETKIITILPGSRESEINRLMPIFKETLEILAVKNSNLQTVIPTIKAVEEKVKGHLKGWPLPVVVTVNDQDKYDAFSASIAALACSGTVSVELAMARLPSVIAYKINPLTAMILRRLVKVKYATLVNIMQDKMIMPEFLQEDCTPEKLARAIQELLENPSTLLRQKHELDVVSVWLGQGQFVPSDRAAKTVLEAVHRKLSQQES